MLCLGDGEPSVRARKHKRVAAPRPLPPAKEKEKIPSKQEGGGGRTGLWLSLLPPFSLFFADSDADADAASCFRFCSSADAGFLLLLFCLFLHCFCCCCWTSAGARCQHNLSLVLPLSCFVLLAGRFCWSVKAQTRSRLNNRRRREVVRHGNYHIACRGRRCHDRVLSFAAPPLGAYIYVYAGAAVGGVY